MLEDGKQSMNKLVFNLNALVDLGEVVTSFNDFRGTIKSSLYLVMGTLSVSKGAIFQFDNNKSELKMLTSKGIDGLNGIKIKLNREDVDELKKTNTFIPNNAHSGKIISLVSRENATLDKIMASILLPLVVKGELVGMISLGKKLSGEEYSGDDYEILSVMTNQVAVSVHNHNLLLKLAFQVNENKSLYNELRLIYYDTIQAFATAIDAKDPYTRGHSTRVSKYCVIIGQEMGLSEKQVEGIKIAGLLHDIGKIVVEKNIINKPTRLTIEEQIEINQHPVVSYEIVSNIRFPWTDIPGSVRYHHEKLDGTGYPERLKGGKIPIGAKILALADAFDAMTSDRPYRKKLTLEDTLNEIKKTVGKHFDHNIVGCFLKVINKDIKGEKVNFFK